MESKGKTVKFPDFSFITTKNKNPDADAFGWDEENIVYFDVFDVLDGSENELNKKLNKWLEVAEVSGNEKSHYINSIKKQIMMIKAHKNDRLKKYTEKLNTLDGWFK